MIEANSLSSAERRLVDAVKAGSNCDLSDGQAIQTSEMADWGAERTIRADVLTALLTGSASRWGVDPNTTAVNLRGAVIRGELRAFHGQELDLQTRHCRFDNGIWVIGATFAGDAFFSNAIFNGEARFSGARFNGDVWFDRATFARSGWFDGASVDGTARFQDAVFDAEVRFSGARFNSDAWFDRAKFASTAWYDGTVLRGASFHHTEFTGEARFNGTAFNSPTAQQLGMLSSVSFSHAAFTYADFRRVVFAIHASFGHAKFLEGASFSRAHFARGASFDTANFCSDAEFDDATFRTDALFTRAKFDGPVWFQGALAKSWGFNSATFAAPDPGPWIGSAVCLERTVLTTRGRVEITASTIDARYLRASDGTHLVLHSASVDLSDSEFLRRSIIAGPGENHPRPPGEGARDFAVGESVHVDEQLVAMRALAEEDAKQRREELETARALAADDAEQLREELEEELTTFARVCALSKLDRATAGELELSNVVLDACTFAGAHDLDQLLIAADCTFRRTRDPLSADAFTRRRLLTGRRVIAEEIAWRNAHTGPKKLTPRTTRTCWQQISQASTAGFARVWRTPRTSRKQPTSTTAKWRCAVLQAVPTMTAQTKHPI
jgi:uncharacterized protein YjbI with pentapeptide repeats